MGHPHSTACARRTRAKVRTPPQRASNPLTTKRPRTKAEGLLRLERDVAVSRALPAGAALPGPAPRLFGTSLSVLNLRALCSAHTMRRQPSPSAGKNSRPQHRAMRTACSDVLEYLAGLDGRGPPVAHV